MCPNTQPKLMAVVYTICSLQVILLEWLPSLHHFLNKEAPLPNSTLWWCSSRRQTGWRLFFFCWWCHLACNTTDVMLMMSPVSYCPWHNRIMLPVTSFVCFIACDLIGLIFLVTWLVSYSLLQHWCVSFLGTSLVLYSLWRHRRL